MKDLFFIYLTISTFPMDVGKDTKASSLDGSITQLQCHFHCLLKLDKRNDRVNFELVGTKLLYYISYISGSYWQMGTQEGIDQ